MEVLNMNKEPETGYLGREGARESCATNKAVNGCIMELVELANTQFEKKAVIELAALESNIKENLAKIKTEIKYLKWLIVTVLFAVIIGKLIGG